MPQGNRESGEEWNRYALALEASQEGFWDWDLIAGRLFGSRRWKAILGLSEVWASLDAWMERVASRTSRGLRPSCARCGRASRAR